VRLRVGCPAQCERDVHGRENITEHNMRIFYLMPGHRVEIRLGPNPDTGQEAEARSAVTLNPQAGVRVPGSWLQGCRFDDSQRPRAVGQKSGGENPDRPRGTDGTLGRNSSESCPIRPEKTMSKSQ